MRTLVYVFLVLLFSAFFAWVGFTFFNPTAGVSWGASGLVSGLLPLAIHWRDLQ